MILTLGLLTSIYFSILIFPKKALKNGHGNSLVGRRLILLLILALMFNINSLNNIEGTLILLDGVSKIDKMILSSSIIYLCISLVLTILIQTKKLGKRPEQYLVLLSSIVAFNYLMISNDWILTITAWELFNLSIYLLVTINSSRSAALSASIKYFLLSALSTSFLLLGVAILYGLTGSMNQDISLIILQYLMDEGSTNNYKYNIPIYLIIITLLFKLGAAPLHNWAPDLYDRLPTHITALMAIGVKIAILLFLLRLYNFIGLASDRLLIFIAILSIIVGSVGLGSQYRIKRFLAYSSISHLGYLLLAYSSGLTGFIYYLIIYALTSIIIFAIILTLSTLPHNNASDSELDRSPTLINQLAGIYKLNPALAWAWNIALFSIAGIP